MPYLEEIYCGLIVYIFKFSQALRETREKYMSKADEVHERKTQVISDNHLGTFC